MTTTWREWVRWKLTYYGIRRRWLVITRPWQDWTELGPIKKRLGISTRYRVEPWVPQRSTIIMWIVFILGIILGKLT